MENVAKFETIREIVVDNLKPLLVIVMSLFTAHIPIHEFLHYNWSEWMPFLEVAKTTISTFALIVSMIVLILNYLRKRNETGRKKS
jgi:hypothetical protein